MTKKNIVLFSDGTGNSSGKLLRTNVWRMYEAVDLGPAAPDKREQIAYYDDGVGNSAFKPLALLGGVFGIGLKRNVLDIYRYACRNYEEGDHLYGFGFSRGAFTMRLLIALIADQGLIPYTGERDLKRNAKAAWRDFCAKNRPRYAFTPIALLSWVRRLATRGVRWLYGDKDAVVKRHSPVLRFVGVWDTVAAYGGPIAEITRAVDNWIYRLSMPNYALHQDVRSARHALALDDERDSFHPLLWDEMHERDLIQRKKNGAKLPAWITPDRLQQVWFTGMHADVGGGYPDESLSYVSLLWMIEEAQKAELRTLSVITDRYQALANSFGPVHDSRGGLGAYYRYQPRNVAAWVDPVVKSTLSLRDPSIRTKSGPKGLLTEVKVHESVIARIESGTDRYAPFVLPRQFTVVPPGQSGENLPQKDDTAGKAPNKDRRLPLISNETRALLADPLKTGAMTDALQSVWNRVWLRRATYFATLFATLLLLTMPAWIGWASEAPFLSDGRTWVGSLIGLLKFIVPAFLGHLIESWELNAFYFLALLVAIGLLWWAGNVLQTRMRDRARKIWSRTLAGQANSKAKARPQGWLKSLLAKIGSLPEKVRVSRTYQRGIQIIKWHVLPNLFGPLLLGLALWAIFSVWTQARLPSLEKAGGVLCPAITSGTPPIDMISRDFETRRTCNAMRVRVVEGQKYAVSFHVVDDWSDGGYPTDPTGLSASAMRWGVGYFGIPLRRVVGAKYLQPVYEIRPDRHDDHSLHNVYMYPLKLRREGEAASNIYRGEFTAKHSGELFLLANDSVLPFTDAMGNYNVRFFYERTGKTPSGLPGNQGSACVIISRAELSSEHLLQAKSPICKEAAARAAALENRTKELRAEGREFLAK